MQYSKLGTVASRIAEQLRTQDLKKLGNIRKISNFGRNIAQCLVSLQELKLCQQQFENTQKRYQTLFLLSSFTGLFHFVPNILYWIVDPFIFSAFILGPQVFLDTYNLGNKRFLNIFECQKRKSMSKIPILTHHPQVWASNVW